MRILRLANVPNNRTGGMSRTMHATTEEFRRIGHEVEQVFSDDFQPYGPRRLHRFTGSAEAARLIRLRLKGGRTYDLIEVHEPLAQAYTRLRLLDRELPPAVCFSYGLEERGVKAMLEYKRLKSIHLPAKSRLTSWLQAKQAGIGVRQADHVICSNATDAQYLAQAGVPTNRITQHHSGVDAEFLSNDTCIRPGAEFRILFMGSWIERKGILDLVPAFVELCRQEPNAILTLAGVAVARDTVMGHFPVDVRQHLRVISHIEGNADLIRLYREHSIFVLPSYFEGQPLSLIEAAACGLAPVVTDIGGNRDFVTHEENGLLVPVGDVNTLTAALLALLRDQERARRFGQAARKLATSYTWRNATQRLCEVYTNLVNRV